MKPLLHVMSAALVVAFAFWAYRENYQTQEALKAADQLRDMIRAEGEAIAVLRAEWAYLNRPERLSALAEAHFPELQLMPLMPEHFGDPALVSYPPQPSLLSLLADYVPQTGDDMLVAEVRP